MGRALGRRGPLFLRARLGHLCQYFKANVKHLLSLRSQGPSAGKPVFRHCYAVPMRASGRQAELRRTRCQRPWLLPALKAYGAERRLGGRQPFDGLPSGTVLKGHGS